MTPLLPQKKKEENFLVLDIGTEAIKALILERRDKKNIVTGLSYEYFDEFSVWNSGEFNQLVIKKAVSKAIQGLTLSSLEGYFEKLPKEVLLGMPANILKARIFFQSLARENQKEKISQSEEEKLRQTVLDKSKEGVSKIYSYDSGILSKDIEFLELEILEIKIDGYPVPHLKGYTGRNLDFLTLVAFSPKAHLERFRQILSSLNLKVSKIIHESRGLLDAFLAPESLYLDVGGELTQLFLIKSGQLKAIDEFGSGGQNFNQELSRVLGLDLIRTRRFKEDYCQGLLSEEVRQRMKGIIEPTVKIWQEQIKLKISENKISVPNNIFIFGGGGLLPEIKEVLENTYNFAKVEYARPENLKNLEIRSKASIDARYIPTLLLCYQR